MRVGFTGTQQGMTGGQAVDFIDTLTALKPTEFHHGDCVGADEQAHDLVRMFFADVRIVVHPPDVDAKRAFKQGDETLVPLPYLMRNKQIVWATEVLLAAPKGDEVARSGTWATVREARRQHRPIYFVMKGETNA